MTLQRAHVKRLIEEDVLCGTKQVLQGFQPTHNLQTITKHLQNYWIRKNNYFK
jgi:hypothetical protein